MRSSQRFVLSSMQYERRVSVIVKQENEDLDCKACGACCLGKSSDEDYVPVHRLDRKRLPNQYKKKLEPLSESMSYLPLKRFEGHEACVALKGKIGKAVACDVYSTRPDFCRAFEKGSAECHKRRAEVFYIRPQLTGD